MANRSILFIDLLGVQKMWRIGGAKAVKSRIQEFHDFIVKQVSYLPNHVHRDAEYTVILTADSVSVMCQDHVQALQIGVHLFEQAFYSTDVYSSPLWLRGVISTWNNQYLPFNTTPIKSKGIQIGTQYVMEDDHLEVLALEKSGFRGMRLLIDESLIQQDALIQRQWSTFKRPLRIVTRLKENHYPEGSPYADILWMADTENHYKDFQGIMATRFKRATSDTDELVQASWTRATFDQVQSLIWLCETYSSTTNNSVAETPAKSEKNLPITAQQLRRRRIEEA